MVLLSDWLTPPVIYERWDCDWPDDVIFDDRSNVLELVPQETKALCIGKMHQGLDLEQLTSMVFLHTFEMSQDLFDQISLCTSLKHLRVAGKKPLANLNTEAEYLSFSSCKKLENFSFFKADPQKVKGIGLSECFAVESLDQLKEFCNLSELYIDGTVTGKRSKFESLESLSRFPNLEYLGIAASLTDTSLQPLHGLSKLKRLWIPCSKKAKENDLVDLLAKCKYLDEIELGLKTFRRGVGFVKRDVLED